MNTSHLTRPEIAKLEARPPVAVEPVFSGDLLLPDPPVRKRVLSGIQPSGDLHLGNKFGAIDQVVQAQGDNERFVFIANLHAMSSQRDGEALRRSTADVALDYLALGLDPEKVALYRQSDLPVVALLAWIFECLTPTGDLDRCVAFKDKVARGLGANAGLFNYPVLQAADILLVNAEVVPVGPDQLQNIELARATASRFNEAYGTKVFNMPKARINQARLVPGLDGGKMSKSYGNTIPIFATPDQYCRLISGIATDSLPAGASRDPQDCKVYALLSLVAEPHEQQDWAQRYRDGGLRHSAIKARLLELLMAHLAPAMQRRSELQAQPWRVEEVLRAGADKAARTARPVMERVLHLVGLDPTALATIPPSGFARHDPVVSGRGWGM